MSKGIYFLIFIPQKNILELLNLHFMIELMVFLQKLRIYVQNLHYISKYMYLFYK